ncbi:hypothetical protein GQ607_005327 [Colletotrichum asianum]|uniref:Uncharacterized protein n=1 Tax=Colletotrichum asianum TaxID=702518 RepID=A0A8H3WET2_9PEZI|nr:hypothetical protein GQ607_005327 [Colletotrichum asianum]
MKSVDLRGLWPRVHSKSGPRPFHVPFHRPSSLDVTCSRRAPQGRWGGSTGGILGVFWGEGRAIRETDRR